MDVWRVGVRSVENVAASAATAATLPLRAPKQRLTWIATLLNSPWGPMLVALFAYGSFVLLRINAFHGDLSRFVVASDRLIPTASGARAGLTVLHGTSGFDGQFYYMLALNPFSPQPTLPGAHYSLGAYRAQRILYPFLVWLLTLGGHARYVPLAMISVNLIAIVVIAALAAMIARRLGREPLAGTMVAFYPGLLLSLAADLSEPLALACALGGLLCIMNRKWRSAALLLTLAVLARETTLLFALALLALVAVSYLPPYVSFRVPALRLIRLIPQADRRGAILAGLAPVLAEVMWQLFLRVRWGQSALQSGGHLNLGAPLVGAATGPSAWLIQDWPPLLIGMHYLEYLYLLALVGFVAYSLWSKREFDHVVFAWAGLLLLGASLTATNWTQDWGFIRALAEFAVTSLLLLIPARPSVRLTALATTMCIWGIVFLTHYAAS